MVRVLSLQKGRGSTLQKMLCDLTAVISESEHKIGRQGAHLDRLVKVFLLERGLMNVWLLGQRRGNAHSVVSALLPASNIGGNVHTTHG